MEGTKCTPSTILRDNQETYQLLSFIGQGGYGSVAKAKKIGESKQFYAIKSFETIDDEENEEYQAFQQTSHMENVVKGFSSFKNETHTHIVMEMLEGGDLWDYLLDYGPMPRKQALILFKQLVKTVGELLRIGLFPGDIKAENLFYDKENMSLKILDLGGFKHMNKKDGLKKCVATPTCSPPEVHLETNSDKREELKSGELHLSWTLGLVLWHMLTGEQKTIYSEEDIKKFDLRITSSYKSYELQDTEAYYLVVQLLALDPAKRLKFWTLHEKIVGTSHHHIISLTFKLFLATKTKNCR